MEKSLSLIKSMKDLLKSELRSKITLNSPLKDMWETLKDYKDKGLNKEDAYEILQELRGEFADENEDKVLELMDFVVGFCAPSMRLY